MILSCKESQRQIKLSYRENKARQLEDSLAKTQEIQALKDQNAKVCKLNEEWESAFIELQQRQTSHDNTKVQALQNELTDLKAKYAAKAAALKEITKIQDMNEASTQTEVA